MALFVQDITGCNGCEPMVPHGLPVSFGSVPSSLIGSIALHNGALKFLYKVPDKLRLQELRPPGSPVEIFTAALPGSETPNAR